MAIANTHDVHVLTSEANRLSIERWTRERGIGNPTFHFFGKNAPYAENRFLARGQSWARYVAWTRESLQRAKQLVSDIEFDVVHHSTFSTCRVASPLWKLGRPTVVGPVGGGESTPWIALGSMSFAQRMYEIARKLANAALPFSPTLRRAALHTDVFVASNGATSNLLRRFGVQDKRIVRMPVVFFSDAELKAIPQTGTTRLLQGRPMRLFASGILEGRKGISIVLEAIKIAKSKGVDCEINIPSRGPEFRHLQKLAAKLGISRAVNFPDTLSRHDYLEELQAAQIYAMPSLRDNCPATLLEAMLCGCVPIVANCNGPGELVPDGAGIKIPALRPREMANLFAEALLDLSSDERRLRLLGEAARAHVRKTFTQQRYLQVMDAVYARAVHDFQTRIACA